MPSTVVNTQDSSGVVQTGACMGTPRYLQSWLSWESDPWGLNLRGQSHLQCGPLQTRHVARGSLDARDAPWDVPSSHSNNKPIPSPGSLWAFFLRLFQNGSNSYAGASVFCLVLFCLLFSSSYSLPYYTIWASCNSFSKDWFGPNACFHNLWWISRANWVRNLSFKVISPSAFFESMLINLWRASSSLSRNLPGVSFSPYSMSANLAYSKVLACAHLSPSRMHTANWLCYGYCLAPQ